MRLLEDINSGKYNFVLFAIIFILFFHQYWCKSTSHCNIKEPMADVSDAELNQKIRQTVKQVYLADVQAIRNLSETANKLQKEGLTIPGDLKVTGKFNYLPKGTIVAFNSTSAPDGWAICNGNNNTPDLRGRFILGSGKGNNLNERKFGATGGSETVTLTDSQMPKHNHSGTTDKDGKHHHVWRFGCGQGGERYWLRDGYADGQGCHNRNTQEAGEHTHTFTTDNTGESKPHENMPPFYVLTYIMKL